MARTSKYYNVTDVDALKAFNSKAVSMEPVVNHLVVMGLLKLFDDVPGVERITDVEPEPEQSKDNPELAKYIGAIATAENLAGVEIQFNDASKIFLADADAMAQLMIVKQEREKFLKGNGKKLFAKPEELQAS